MACFLGLKSVVYLKSVIGAKFIALMFSVLSLQGCANSTFFSPSKSAELNPEVRWLASQSGNDIAYLWLPTNHAIAKGAVIHFHGNSGHMEETKEKVDWLTEHGYDVMVFDYSGFGHSSGQVGDKAAYQDATSILHYIEALKAKSDIPVYTVATSTGGNIFLRAWADHPIEIDGIIIDSSFTSYVDTAEHVVEQGLFGELYSWMVHVVMRDDYAANQVADTLPIAPSLVLHCEQDKVVPIEFGEGIYHQLEGEKEFWRLTECKHARGLTTEYPEYQARLVNWLQKTAPDYPAEQAISGAVLAKN